MKRRGSALLMVLWVILTLSVIALSFAFEAKLQGGINIYVQNKNRVKRLIDAGRILGEVIMLGYQDGKQWTEDEDIQKELEEDRWYVEKQALKYSKGCTIGPIMLDDTDLDSGTIKVEISVSTADSASGININKLNKEDDPNYEDRWHMILDMCGVPREEIDDGDGHRFGLQNYVIACWQDYRDGDETRTDIPDSEYYDGAQGAEKAEYEEYYDDHEDDYAEEDRFEPANGEIVDLKELSRVLCFQKFPAILTGGPLFANQDPKDKDAVTISQGLMNLGLFGVIGDGKINVNNCTVNQLLTVPGIFNIDELDADDKSESRELAEAIVACRKIKPEGYEVPEDRTEWNYGEFTSDWWTDLKQRLADEYTHLEPLSEDAKRYLTAQPSEGEGTLFKMKITAALMDMEYSAECECYVKDKKVRYISWKEE